MSTEPTEVVTAFLRNRDEVLLLRRSEEVGSYRGKWGGVSGHVEPEAGRPADPEAAVRAEIDEETGLLDACEPVRRGESFLVEDEAGGYTWRVYPFLFDCGAREVRTNEETTEVAWVPPTEILRRETVPALWTSYDHVRPTVGTVRADEEHGSAYLSVRALEVLRDRAGELAAAAREEGHAGAETTRPSAGDAAGESAGGATGESAARSEDAPDDAWAQLAALAEELLDARPGMAALRTRVDRAVATADERTPAAVEASTRAAIREALDADEEAAAVAAEHVAGERVLTLSRSGTVLEALRGAPVDGVVVAESRPDREGVGVAEALAAADRDVTLVVDAAVAHYVAEEAVDAVLVGADTVRPDGGVVNKVGTRGAALAAAREGVPCYAVAARDKVAPTDAFHQEYGDEAAVYDGDADLAVANPRFDGTPPDLVDAVLTEDGALDAEAVRDVADEHAELAAWRR